MSEVHVLTDSISIPVNSSLPIHLTAADVKQYPEFVKLLSALTSHLTPSGMSVGLYRNLTEVCGGNNHIFHGLYGRQD